MQKVLVVDNNTVVLKFMDSFLSKNGYSVKTAENGLVAIDLVQDYTPDIIFIDLIMPYIKGELLVSIFRENKKLSDISIIILSGVAAEIELDYIAIGADACIAKGPFNSMGKHILFALDKIRQNGKKLQYKPVVGLESVFKRSMTEELVIAKQHWELILESISDCIIELSTDLRIVYINNAAICFLKKNKKNIIASNILTQIYSEWHEKLISYLEQIKSGSIVESIELSREKDCYLVTAKYLQSANCDSIVLIIKDISLQKQEERALKNEITEHEMMIKEVYHRVKNNLAMVSSIINLQMGESENDVEIESLNDLRSRIDSISMVHAKLFRSKDLNNISLNEYINDLVGNLIDSLVSDGKTVMSDISIPEVDIDFDNAVPLGIVFTELTTNALKYAFEGRQFGMIKIIYTEKGEEVEIIFADNGVGLPSCFSIDEAESLGFNLIISLVMQLGGNIAFENKNGAVFTIILPRLNFI